MLKIRLQRVGRKNDPSFRVVVTDSRRGPKSGNNIEVVGSHNPSQGSPVIKEDRIKYWLTKGAKVSDTIHNLLVKRGVIEGKTIDVLPKRKPKEEAPASVENSGEAQPAPNEETPTEGEPAPEMKEETPAETAPVEVETPTEITPIEEKAEEAPVEEPKEEEKPTE